MCHRQHKQNPCGTAREKGFSGARKRQVICLCPRLTRLHPRGTDGPLVLTGSGWEGDNRLQIKKSILFLIINVNYTVQSPHFTLHSLRKPATSRKQQNGAVTEAVGAGTAASAWWGQGGHEARADTDTHARETGRGPDAPPATIKWRHRSKILIF